MYFVYSMISFLFWPAVIIYLISRNRRNTHSASDPQDLYTKVTLSKEDSLSQVYLLISYFFFSLVLFVINLQLGQPWDVKFLILVSAVIGMLMAYTFKSVVILMFGVLGLIGWWTANASVWVEKLHIRSSSAMAVFALIFVLLYVVGHLHEQQLKTKKYAQFYLLFGILGITGWLFFLSTKPGISAFSDMTHGDPVYVSWQMVVSLIAVLCFTIAAALDALHQKVISVYEFFAVIFLVALFGIMAILPEQVTFLSSRSWWSGYGDQLMSPVGIFWASVFNLLIFFELLGLIFSGYQRKETWLINLGATFLFLLIIQKYFDWLFTFLDKSIFFIGAGILMFVVGYLMEKGRRYMISTIKKV